MVIGPWLRPDLPDLPRAMDHTRAIEVKDKCQKVPYGVLWKGLWVCLWGAEG